VERAYTIEGKLRSYTTERRTRLHAREQGSSSINGVQGWLLWNCASAMAWVQGWLCEHACITVRRQCQTRNSFFGSQSGDENASAGKLLGVSILELEWPATLQRGPGCA
jgi:hypothetical protein